MLTIIRSSEPTAGNDVRELATHIRERLAPIVEAPQRVYWIVPTQRRVRQIVRSRLDHLDRPAALLPSLGTLEGFAREAASLSPPPGIPYSAAERLLSVAGTWQRESRRPVGPGLIAQLDQLVRDWQTSLAASANPKSADLLERFVARFLHERDDAGRIDQPGTLRHLIGEIRQWDSWAKRFFLSQFALVFVEGFSRLEAIEAELLAAASSSCDVVIWLPCGQDQSYSSSAETLRARLASTLGAVEMIDHQRPAATEMARFGRALFPAHGISLPAEKVASPAGLFSMHPTSRLNEVEEVARRIKRDFLAAEAAGAPFRLSEVAVMIPSPSYGPLVREVFPRAGLEFNLAGQSLELSSSRPGRTVKLALDLIAGRWRYELLRDFLNQPIVRARLDCSERLGELFRLRNRNRVEQSLSSWKASWDALLACERQALERRDLRELDDDDFESATEKAGRAQRRIEACTQLVVSIERMLEPVGAIEAAMARLQPGASRPLAEAAEAIRNLLDALHIHEWLSPLRQRDRSETGSPVPWVEFEKDHRAYSRLLDVLDELAEMDDSWFPRTEQGATDVELALRLALDHETFQIRTEDDAGVQVLGIRELRGLKFRHVYALGLIEGSFAPVAGWTALGGIRRRRRELLEQVEQREREWTLLFEQIFECATERLVLSTPVENGEDTTLVSRFVAAAMRRTTIPALEPLPFVADVGHAGRMLGRRAAEIGFDGGLGSLWRIDSTAHEVEHLEGTFARSARWSAAANDRLAFRINNPALLERFFPAEAAFSPSSFEDYAKCPFRFFGGRVLRLESDDDDTTWRAWGSLVHAVLERFYRTLRERELIPPGEPLRPVTAADRPLLIDIFEQELARLPEGAIPPELPARFVASKGGADLFLDAIDRLEGRYGQWLSEYDPEAADGAPVLLGEDANGRPVYVRGKVDRVDRKRDEADKCIVIDFKTGSAPDRKTWGIKRADGRMIQLPLYAAMLARSLKGVTIDGGLYMYLGDRIERAESALHPCGSTAALRKNAREIPFDPDAAVKRAVELATRIRAGDFSLTDFGPSDPNGLTECRQYCTFRDACRHPEGYAVNER